MEIIKPKENELYNDYISRILSERNNTKDTENYQERHHIIPKSLGGSNEKSNLIWLYSQEHYYAHKLLALENPHNQSIQYAFFMMSNNCDKNGERKKNIKLTPEEYAEQRKILHGSMSGENNPMYGRIASEETRAKMRKSSRHLSGPNHPLYGTHRTEEQKKAQSEKVSQLQKGENNSFYGKKHTEASLEKMRKAHKGFKHKQETKEKMSKKMKGHLVSQECREKIVKSRRGKYSGKNNSNAKAVVCIETKQIFFTFKDAALWSGTSSTSISHFLRGDYKSAGEHPETGEKLHWRLATEKEIIEFNKSVETAGDTQ